MIKSLILLVSIVCIFHVHSQSSWTEMTGKQKAFFYQLTRKVDNLKPEFFHLFQFTDSVPFVNDTLPDYPYIEKEIESDSSKLICHFTDMARKNRGLLMDLGTHFATWELGLILQFRDSEKPQFQYLKPKVVAFEKLILENAPSASAKMWSDETYTFTPKIKSYFSPNLTIVEKIAALKNSSYNTDEKMTLLNAIYNAQEAYIGNRATEIVGILTGTNIMSQNFIIAAGDGKNWDELESVIRTKYNRSLPDPKAFFNYSLVGKRTKNSEDKIMSINQNSVVKMQTKANLKTNLHMDVWGYHPQRQTTVIIRKGGNAYALFGNSENRYLSPSPLFSEEGVTYKTLIDELEYVWIADLKDRIYGKKGFDYLIDQYEKKIVKTRYNIKETEKSLNKIRYRPEGPPKMKKKKKSRKQKKKGQSTSYQDSQGVPRGKLSKTAKKRQIEQHNLVGYEGQLQTELSTLKQLKKDKEEAFDLLSRYEAKLDNMKKIYEYGLMSYSNDKYGNFTFTDGTKFNAKTQDLIFSETKENQYFEVILVSFGEKVMDKNYEEVFLHLNLSYTGEQDVYTLLHESKMPYTSINNSTSDSIQIRELFWQLEKTKLPIEISSYVSGELIDSDSSFNVSIKNLVHVNDTIKMIVSGKYNQFKNEVTLVDENSIQDNYPNLKPIEVVSIIEVQNYFNNWKVQMTEFAENWISDPKSKKKVIKSLKKIKLKQINIENNSIKI